VRTKAVKGARFSLLSLLLGVICSPAVFCQGGEDSEHVSINSNLVNLAVSVFSRKPGERVQDLKQSDFAVLDQGHPQQISFFESTSAPFDLVLLLDLSGSTREKIGLIKKSCARFVKAARPIDRIGIVTFTAETTLVSPLTNDRVNLLKRINAIKKPEGGTSFWDALAFVLDDVVAKKNDGRRSAIIVITDGVDNALPDIPGDGSKITFLQLIEKIRESDATILPIYLDTEEDEVRYRGASRHAYELARKSLGIIAGQSGGIAYRANKLQDLDGVYDNVIAELGNVYSVGYQPPGDSKGGEWHNVQVEIVNRPDLAARTRPGYVAK